MKLWQSIPMVNQLRHFLPGRSPTGSPLAPLRKGGMQIKVPLFNGDLGGSLPAPLRKGGMQIKVPLFKGDLGGSLPAPLEKARTGIKVPLFKGDLGGSLPAPLEKARTGIKVPLFNGDLGGSPLAPLRKGGMQIKVPLFNGDLGGSLPAPLEKARTGIKVPLFKGDLGGSNPLAVAISRSLLPLLLCLFSPPALAQSALRVTVNSPQDGTIQPDDQLTLREAISLVNGSLPLEKLSPQERSLVAPSDTPRIEFNLPTGNTTIRLVEELPALVAAGLVIDGSSQPGYRTDSVMNEIPLPLPLVTITPVADKEVFRGLTIVGDRITIRGLSLYGFTNSHGNTASTPPADIFIAHRFPPPDIRKQHTPANFSPFYADDRPPQDVVIENNWLGIPPGAVTQDGVPPPPAIRSAFGVSVFHGSKTVIRRNWIAYHDGSAIITAVNADQMQISENVITSNGLAGMPDAIRLEGKVNQAQVTGNLICGNDGSGVYLFKPSGSVQIHDNQITYNGRRLRRSAVYLMGSNHQVSGNQIANQAGPGVVVSAYPRARQNLIQANRFTRLEGLSIDLVTDHDTGVSAYQVGDGLNPARNSWNRQSDTGNAAVNAPRFVTDAFVALGQAAVATTDNPLLAPTAPAAPVQVFGTADPNVQVDVYRVVADGSEFGPLTELIGTAETDKDGKFSLMLDKLRLGDSISAIATSPRYGTSEPARNAVIRSVDPNQPQVPAAKPPSSLPRCVTPIAQKPPEPIPLEPIRLQVPRNIHFALDQASLSPTTIAVLNRIAQVLRANPTILVEIQGHTDPRASDAYNLDLGMRRAIAARNYLLRQGIAAERMTIRSFGERQRAAEGATKLDYARDRRVEFTYKDARDIEVIIQDADLQLEP